VNGAATRERENDMNEALHADPSSETTQLSPSTLRRTPRGAPAANDDCCVELSASSAIDGWARHASGANGFGDAAWQSSPSSLPVASTGIQRRARTARAQAIAELIATSLASVWAAMDRAYEWYCTYRIARETYRALRMLDDRTLRDLGYDRSEIESVATEVASSRGGWS
jgi:uncharacterized protein YjiS (DUF1127 family)